MFCLFCCRIDLPLPVLPKKMSVTNGDFNFVANPSTDVAFAFFNPLHSISGSRQGRREPTRPRDSLQRPSAQRARPRQARPAARRHSTCPLVRCRPLPMLLHKEIASGVGLKVVAYHSPKQRVVRGVHAYVAGEAMRTVAERDGGCEESAI